MRSYIFTPAERRVIAGFFTGKVKPGADIMRQTLHRIRSFHELSNDVDLYLRLRKAVAAKPT